MQDQLRRAIQQYQLIASGDLVVVGVSGGADSLALMHTLTLLQASLNFKLHIATLDHGWRGEQSAADAQFVVNVAQSFNLPVTSEQINLRTHNEAAARKARYDFFARVVQAVGANRVATAHHTNDQAETVLMNLIRGTGLQGLGGMRSLGTMPYHPSIPLIRPLLSVSRQEIEAYCQQHQLKPRIDPTNADTHYLRNKVRLDILPQLAQINPNIYQSLTRLAETAALDADYLQQTVKTLSKSQHVKITEDTYRIHRAFFQSQHTAIQRRLLIQAVQDLNPSADIDHKPIVAGVRVAVRGKQGTIAQFPGNVCLRVSYEWLIVERADEHPSEMLKIALQPGSHIPLPVGAPVSLTGGRLCLTPSPQPGWHVLGVGYPPLNASFHVRTRQPGDRIAPPGMAGRRQTLKKWMINRKVPATLRDQIPIIETEEQIFAVVHPRYGIIAHPYHKPKDKRSRALSLTWQPFNNT